MKTFDLNYVTLADRASATELDLRPILLAQLLEIMHRGELNGHAVGRRELAIIVRVVRELLRA